MRAFIAVLFVVMACSIHTSIADIFKEIDSDIKKELGSSFGYQDKDNIDQELFNIVKKLSKDFKSIDDFKRHEDSQSSKLTQLKQIAYQIGMKWPDKFLGESSIFDIEKELKQTDGDSKKKTVKWQQQDSMENHSYDKKLFELIRKMPKFGYLHCHQTAMSTVKFMQSMITDSFLGGKYYDKIYLKHHKKNEMDIKGFRIAKNEKDLPKLGEDEKFTILKDVVKRLGDGIFAKGQDEFMKIIRPLLTMKGKKNSYGVWDKFTRIFDVIGGLLNFEPYLREHLKFGMSQMLADNIQYVEIKATLGMTYDLDTEKYTPEQAFAVYESVCNEFKQKNPDWFGARLIYSPYKGLSYETQMNYFEIYQNLKRADKSGFLIGFDLTGPEEFTPMLKNYVEPIQKMQRDMPKGSANLFIHAGQTKNYGTTDENLFYAVHLKAKRIGDGFALIKHPHLMEEVKKNDICIEGSPISTEAMGLSDDYRNHPIGVLLAHNVPMVIAPEDPSFQETYPLSHDFFVTFAYIASYHHDMRILRQFAYNSIKYSALSEKEKKEAMVLWMRRYLVWLNEVDKYDNKDLKDKLHAIETENEDFFRKQIGDEKRMWRVQPKEELTPELLAETPYLAPKRTSKSSNVIKDKVLTQMHKDDEKKERKLVEEHNKVARKNQ